MTDPELKPEGCPWCNRVPIPAGGHYEVNHDPDCVIAHIDRFDNVAAWNRRASGWVSVEEREPEDLEEVLIWPRPHRTSVAIYEAGIFGWDGREYRPTHWSQLPGPPEATP